MVLGRGGSQPASLPASAWTAHTAGSPSPLLLLAFCWGNHLLKWICGDGGSQVWDIVPLIVATDGIYVPLNGLALS